jgi:uncharacterized repeat protein (TIGR01451 family)
MRKDKNMATFFNRATLTYGTNSITSNTVSGEIVQTLSVAKNASTDEYFSGSVLTYAVSLVNSGATALNALTLTDDLGEFAISEALNVRPLSYVPDSILYYVNGVLQPTPAVVTGAPLVITGISVPAGGSAVIVYNATVNEFAPLASGSAITNTVTVSGNSALGDLTAEETVSVADTPLLSILKSLSPETVAENGTLTYTLLVENRGNAPVTSDLTVSDTFDPILENITVTYNGNLLTEGKDYTYDEATGVFTTLPSVITLPAAQYLTDPATGEVVITPGTAVIKITGTV